MSDLYENDALAWSERQAALLRMLAEGQRVNELIDWSNVIEEVQDVGLSQLRACRSFLRQALIHLLKLHAQPDSLAASHWNSEVMGFLFEARDSFSASMRQRIEVPDVYRTALKQVQADLSGQEHTLLPADCPVSLDDLLQSDPNIPDLVLRFGGQERLAPPPEGA